MTNSEFNRCRAMGSSCAEELPQFDFFASSILKLVLVGLFFFFLLPQPVLANALDLPKDANGWTIFTPSSDSHIMYVSQNGNDSTGTVYTAAAFPDPFNPSFPNTFKTYAAAKAQTRSGYPDWVLFKRGDIFNENMGGENDADSIKSGRSKTEPALVGAYGTTGLSPLFKLGATDSALSIHYTRSSTSLVGKYVAISGLDFYGYTKNPADPGYLGTGGATNGIRLTSNSGYNKIGNILIEGCRITYCVEGIGITTSNPRDSTYIISDICIRRNVIAYNYSGQGMSSWGVNNFLVEENVFDHNGWLIQNLSGDSSSEANGQANYLTHNIYAADINNATFRNNIIARASSIGLKVVASDPKKLSGLVMDNNLFIDGEIGIDIDNNYPINPDRIVGAFFSNNVLYNIGASNTTNRNISWGVRFQGWAGGSIFNNMLLNTVPMGVGSNTIGITSGNDISKGVEISKNIFRMRVDEPLNSLLSITRAPEMIGLSIHDNYLERLGNGNRILDLTGASFGSLTIKANQYYSIAPSMFGVNGVLLSRTQWTSGYEPDATFTEKIFPDETKTVETYLASIGKTATLESFYALCMAQNRYYWDPRLSANASNTWIRDGFGMVSGFIAPTPIPTPAVTKPTGLRIVKP